MRFFKRLLLWLLEVVLQALLMGSLMVLMFGHDPQALIKDLAIYSLAVSYMFFMTGFVLTSFIARVALFRRTAGFYSLLCTLLFILHFELLNISIGGAFAPSDRHKLFVKGAIGVFLITLATSFLPAEQAMMASGPVDERLASRVPWRA